MRGTTIILFILEETWNGIPGISLYGLLLMQEEIQDGIRGISLDGLDKKIGLSF